jgi:hypothetical protein
MKKNIIKLLILLGTILLIEVGMLGFLAYQVEIGINPDPAYNTVYPSLFNENIFLDLKPGISADQLVVFIGEPFDICTPKPVHIILYSDYDVSIGYDSGVTINDTASKISFLVLSFDSLELTIKIFNRDHCDKEKEDSLLQKTYYDIVSEFGNPRQEISCRGSIWTYSKLRDGGYRGKHPVINIRRLILAPNNILERIVIG